ncbi:ty1-copia retrotransposon protein [Cucumis melo var. makuwa]|uniref:Ty1-copia retrotransposon protein n=1 Tax=Cucumis melo var. makuwa TaxID=1194695 RepID=A0A5D3BGN1_CUCMM|nr:ty1-copia retrotransposon protein [Cucumis melo var. makuwa]TYJ98196.1 ty1-copia retrotransposon protein [Cucumis melo var. makuwa]
MGVVQGATSIVNSISLLGGNPLNSSGNTSKYSLTLGTLLGSIREAWLEVDYILATDLPFNLPTTTLAPSDSECSTEPSATAIAADQVKKDQVIDHEKYAKDNKTVCGHRLNHMTDPLFDLFVAQKSMKDIWSTLESRYEEDDAR